MSSAADRGADEAARFHIARSPRWPEVARVHLSHEPLCAGCALGMGPSPGVQVHHVIPFHFCVLLGRRDLELDERNLLTLCESEPGRPGPDHHLLIGHLDSFQSLNLNVARDARAPFHGLSASVLRENAAWVAEVRARFPPLDALSEAQRTALRVEMDARMPMLAVVGAKRG